MKNKAFFKLNIFFHCQFISCISLFSTHTHTLTQTAPCGGSFSSDEGEIISPNWPGDYQAQSACTWRITVPTAKSIRVAFTHFEVQAANLFGNCVDYVEIFNGESLETLGWLYFSSSCVHFGFFFFLSRSCSGQCYRYQCTMANCLNCRSILRFWCSA